MHRRFLSLSILGFLSILFFNWGCTKIDTTNLGGDLLPIVDNVNTFDTTFVLNATQNDFTDTTVVINTDNQVIGNINNDPLFGKTVAHSYFQLKPILFPYSFGNKDSIIGLDSVVLCLSYKYFWGDSTIPQKLQVFEVTNQPFADSAGKGWLSNTQPTTGAIPISNLQTIDVRRLHDYMKYAHRNDSINNQIRIPLSAAYATRLFGSDSSLSGPGNHAFYNDSIYRRTFNGIGVKAMGFGAENGLIYINLSDTNTKLEIHYRMKSYGLIDTTFKIFKLFPAPSGNVFVSSTANYVVRDRTGSASVNPPPTDIYLQTQPGTYANISIPGLTGYSNRIIHRAELIIDQIPDPNPVIDSMFEAPNFLYLDLKIPGSAIPTQYKTIYTDLNPNIAYDPDFLNGNPFYPTGGPDYSYFGGFIRKKIGPLGVSINYYNINITRYVQQMVTKQNTNYELRLFPAYRFHYPQISPEYVAYTNNVAYGRVRIGSGSHPNYPMRLHVVYSKIK